MKYDSYLHLLTCWEPKKKKEDEQAAAERNKKCWFHFPQVFLGLGCKCFCYQKLREGGKGKRQWQSQQ